LKLGTLSFERRRDQMVLPVAQRRECIAHITGKYGPDLLLCAGWSLETDADLDELIHDTRISTTATILIVEVRDSTGAPEQTIQTNRVYLIGPNNYVRSLGWQAFVESAELKAENGASRLALFEKFIPEKSATVGGKKLFVLCCGEINVLEGRNPPITVRSAIANEALANADIIVNPTHDRMGNAGTLLAKRAWLSRRVDARERVYVSASNWNSLQNNGKKQTPSRTLHTVFVSGEQREMTCFDDERSGADDKRRYVYRECEVSF
jgi:hypothetical protein